jgi:hypothetical protein
MCCAKRSASSAPLNVAARISPYRRSNLMTIFIEFTTFPKIKRDRSRSKSGEMNLEFHRRPLVPLKRRVYHMLTVASGIGFKKTIDARRKLSCGLDDSRNAFSDSTGRLAARI